MIRQIFKQIWFYRRGSAWLFAELLVIAVVSWFVVNRIWNVQYRIHAIPDGIDYDGVYVLSLEELYPGQYGYDSTYDTDEARMENFFRVGDMLRQMPQIQSQAPINMTPCLGSKNLMTILVDSVTSVNTAVMRRISGAEDFRLLGFRLLQPESGELVDEPNTFIISEDLAMTLFHGENPLGKTLGDALDDSRPGYTSDYDNRKITGVIANVRMSPDAENIPMLIDNTSKLEYFEDIVFREEYKYAFRTVPGVDAEEFAAELGRKLESGGGLGNYRVREVVSYREMVEDRILSGSMDRLFLWKALRIFLIINVLLAVVSISWLRMEERRGEISVRRAMGGSGWRILAQSIGEIWAVTAAAALIACVVVINIIVMGKMNIVGETDQFMLPVTRELYPLLFDPVLHFLAVEGIVLGLLFIMVTVAVAVPVLLALRQLPVEGLRDE